MVPQQDSPQICHQGKLFACTWPDCGQTFAFQEILKLHMRMHAAAERLKCKECNVEFHKKCDLDDHLADHRSNSFPCTWPDCDRSFAFNEILTLHLSLHNMGDRKKLKCSVCHMQFYDNYNLEVHLREHSAVKQQTSFSCTWPNCGQIFAFSEVLELHLRMHARDKILLCTLCNMEFHSDDHLTKHEKHHFHFNNSYVKPSEIQINGFLPESTHAKLDSEDNDQNVNGNLVFNKLTLNKRRNKRMHLIKSANLIKRQYTKRFRCFCSCSNCAKNKPNRRTQHICDYIGCGKLFSAPSLLIKHTRIHHDERKFVCDFENCTKSFRTVTDLRWHRRFNKHFRIQDDVKETPSDRQSSRIRRNRHQLRCLCSNCINGNLDQNISKIHVCDVAGCNSQFLAPSLLLVHEKVVHGEKYVKPFGAKLMRIVTDDESSSAEIESELHFESNSFTRDLNDPTNIREFIDSKPAMNRKRRKKLTCGWKNCTKSFFHNWSIRLHCKSEHGTSCLKCWKSFSDVGSLNIHLAENHKSPISSSNSLLIKTDTNDATQDICNFNQGIVSHVPQYDETPYKCRDCDFTCTWLFDLSNHQKTHNEKPESQAGSTEHESPAGSPEFKLCTFKNCGKSFRTTYDLKRHCLLANHFNRLPQFSRKRGRYVCGWGNCTKSYTLQSGLTNHRQIDHGYRVMPEMPDPAISEKYDCCFCSYCVNSKQAANNPPGIHICDFNECGNLFETPASLLIHKRIHIEDGPFICKFDNCSYSFKTNALRERHHCLPHNNENRYSCLCGFKCQWLYQLWNHLRCHSVNKINSNIPENTTTTKITDVRIRVENKTSDTNSTVYNAALNTAKSWHQIVI